jgi:GntR family transcriptional regulator
VSRGTLRQSIAILEQEGLLSRRQGLGTFIVPHTARLRNVLNTNFGITDLIRDTGGRPATSRLNVSSGTAEERVAKKLGISVEEPVAVIERIRTADDLPVAYTTDFLPVRHLQSRGLDVEGLEQVLRDRGSLYACLRDMGLVVDGGVTDLRAATADRRLAAALQVKVGAPLLLLEQIDYGANGMVVLYSDEYLPAYLTVQVWRKGPG